MIASRSAVTRFAAACVIISSGVLAAEIDDAVVIDAVKGDDRAAVIRLLAQGADVNARQSDGATALAWATMRSNLDISQLLLEANADPDLTNALGIGPLGLAIENGSPAMVRLLLESGASPNVARESGETPLMTAARHRQIEVMKLLLDHGANANAREKKFGQTALMWATSEPDAVRLLVDRGADVQLVTRVWKVRYTIYAPSTFTLGKTGIPWNTDGEYVSRRGGQNALFFAVQRGDLESARVLLEAGLDVNSVAADGTTPLLAALYKWVALDHAFVPGRSAPARSGSSQRFGADLAMARLLLEHGASAAGVDGANYTPLHGAVLAVAWAARSGDRGERSVYRRAPALLSLGSPGQKEVTYSPDDAIEVVRRLLKAGADPNRQTRYPTPGPVGDVRINPAPPGSSAFHMAAGAYSAALVKILADHGADPDLVRKDGHTPFTVAVVAGDLTVVKEMVALGADLSGRYNPDDKYPDPVEAITLPRQEQTVVHIAAGGLSPDIVEYLHSQGAPITKKNSAGETPLDLADHQERFKEAAARQSANGDPARLRAVVRPTETTDAIKKLLAE